MIPPHERLAAFLRAQGWNQEEAADNFDCSQAMVSGLLRGAKLPGRLLANRIEAVTAASAVWDDAITSEEWDVIELARKAEKKAPRGGAADDEAA